MEKIVVSSPGKVILAGEHAVVYGYPAIVAAINKRLRVSARLLKEKKIVIKDKYEDLGLARFAINECLKVIGGEYQGVEIEIESNLLTTGGMGSSAAMATGIVWSMLKNKDQATKDKVIKIIEDKQHGKSSGIDQEIIKQGGVIKFEKGEAFKEPNLKSKASTLKVLLIDSGKPEENTGEMVKQVAKGNFLQEFKRMGELVANWRVELIKENQKLLEKIGVVGEKAKKMIRKIESVSGVAKVCGAGGLKLGSGVIMAYSKNIEELIQLAMINKWPHYRVKLGGEGARYE